jgi:hypothetical protein
MWRLRGAHGPIKGHQRRNRPPATAWHYRTAPWKVAPLDHARGRYLPLGLRFSASPRGEVRVTSNDFWPFILRWTG